MGILVIFRFQGYFGHFFGILEVFWSFLSFGGILVIFWGFRGILVILEIFEVFWSF